MFTDFDIDHIVEIIHRNRNLTNKPLPESVKCVETHSYDDDSDVEVLNSAYSVNHNPLPESVSKPVNKKDFQVSRLPIGFSGEFYKRLTKSERKKDGSYYLYGHQVFNKAHVPELKQALERLSIFPDAQLDMIVKLVSDFITVGIDDLTHNALMRIIQAKIVIATRHPMIYDKEEMKMSKFSIIQMIKCKDNDKEEADNDQKKVLLSSACWKRKDIACPDNYNIYAWIEKDNRECIWYVCAPTKYTLTEYGEKMEIGDLNNILSHSEVDNNATIDNFIDDEKEQEDESNESLKNCGFMIKSQMIDVVISSYKQDIVSPTKRIQKMTQEDDIRINEIKIEIVDYYNDLKDEWRVIFLSQNVDEDYYMEPQTIYDDADSLPQHFISFEVHTPMDTSETEWCW